MKLILTIFCLVIIYSFVNSVKQISYNHYYIKSTGSNAADGQSDVTAWKDISKINSFTFSDFDTISFKKGDTILADAMLTVNHANLVFNSYGTGTNPVFSGFNVATGFVDSSGIWSAVISNSVLKQNTVLIGDTIRAKGRFPKLDSQYVIQPPLPPKGVIQKSSPSTTRILGANALPYNFTGAECVAMCYAFFWDVSKIDSIKGDTIVLKTPTSLNSGSVYYFIQNSPKICTRINDWAYDSTLKKLYVRANTQPVNVKYSHIDTLFKNHSFNNVTVDGIDFEGANKICVSTDTLNTGYAINCNYKNSFNGIVPNHATKFTIDNNTMTDMLNDGIFTSQFCDSITITNNTIRRAGMLIGMGANGNDADLAIFCATASSGSLIQYNKTDSIGFNGISVLGKPLVEKNLIINTCYTKADAGGFYTCGAVANSGLIVRHNIILNTVGYFFQPQDRIAAAIYLDCSSNGVIIDSNTTYGSKDANIILNFVRNVTFRHNNCIDTTGVLFSAPNGYAYQNTIITDNIFYQKNKLIENVYSHILNSAGNVQDSNYVLRPDSIANQFRFDNTFYSLAGWQSYSGLDTHSTVSLPANVSSKGKLFYNATKNDSTIVFIGLMKDARGVNYNGSLTLHSFESALLFPSTIPTKKKYGNLIFN